MKMVTDKDRVSLRRSLPLSLRRSAARLTSAQQVGPTLSKTPKRRSRLSLGVMSECIYPTSPESSPSVFRHLLGDKRCAHQCLRADPIRALSADNLLNDPSVCSFFHSRRHVILSGEHETEPLPSQHFPCERSPDLSMVSSRQSPIRNHRKSRNLLRSDHPCGENNSVWPSRAAF